MRIAINRGFGGFDLSVLAVLRYAELSGLKLYPCAQIGHDFRDPRFRVMNDPAHYNDTLFVSFYKEPPDKLGKLDDSALWSDGDIERTDPILIKVIEELGLEVNTSVSKIEIIEIPDDIEWGIDEYDGLETVEEKHRSWS